MVLRIHHRFRSEVIDFPIVWWSCKYWAIWISHGGWRRGHPAANMGGFGKRASLKVPRAGLILSRPPHFAPQNFTCYSDQHRQSLLVDTSERVHAMVTTHTMQQMETTAQLTLIPPPMSPVGPSKNLDTFHCLVEGRSADVWAAKQEIDDPKTQKEKEKEEVSRANRLKRPLNFLNYARAHTHLRNVVDRYSF